MNPFQELLKCSEDFSYFVEEYVKIIHPTKGLLPFKPFDFQQKLFDAYEKNQYNIALKFRQGGFTTYTVLYALWKAMFHTNQKIVVLSKSQKQAVHVAAIAKLALASLPDWMKQSFKLQHQTYLQFSWTSSTLSFQAIDKNKIPGQTTLVIIDEVAFIPNMAEHWTYVFPKLGGASCILLSTTNGVGNWFEEIWHYAGDGKNQFKQIVIDYHEHPEYTQETIEALRKILGAASFAQEVECQFVVAQRLDIDSMTNNELTEKMMDLRVNRSDRLLLLEIARRLSLR